jgi:hypothetical protein
MEETNNNIGCFGYLYIYGRYVFAFAFFIVIWRGCGNSHDSDLPLTAPAAKTENSAQEPDNTPPAQTTYKYYPAGQFLSEGNKLYIDEGAQKKPYGMISNIEDIEGKTIVTISTYDGRVINFTQHEFSKVKLYVYSGDF